MSDGMGTFVPSVAIFCWKAFSDYTAPSYTTSAFATDNGSREGIEARRLQAGERTCSLSAAPSPAR